MGFLAEDADRYNDDAWGDPTYCCDLCGSRWAIPKDEEEPCPKDGCGGILRREQA